MTEQIDAGARLANSFGKKIPLQAAFWLKASDDGQWFLYLASDQISDSNFDVAYGEVLRLLGRGPHMWLDPFQVKVTPIDHPVAKSVLEIQQKYPGNLSTRLRNSMLGGQTVDEAHIYALPIALPS